MTDDTTDTDDTHEFTTESSPSEQAYERKVGEAAAFVEKYLGALGTDEAPAHIFIGGCSGSGRPSPAKSKKLAEELDEAIQEAAQEGDWSSPKDDTDAQNLDVSSTNPFNVIPLDSDSATHDNGGTYS
jgi:hypothetical protein